MTRPRAFFGFTLIETIVVVALTALIMTVLGSLIVYFYKTNEYALEESTAVDSARTGVEDAMRYLREASYGSDGSYPLQSAATSSIVFFADVDGGPDTDRVTYERIGGTLYRGVAAPTGSPLSYANATTATSTVATYVVNDAATPIFRYYDDTGAELSAPFPLTDIAEVQTTLEIDVNVSRAPTTFTLTSAATLRNLKDQP